MATFHTVWSVDLGKASLKAVKLRREGNNIEILAVDKIDYPIGTNGVDTSQQAKEALNAFKIRNDVREPVVVAHPGQGTFSRFIKVPAFEAKKLKEMVGYEASQQIPFPLDEVIWDYHLVNRDYLAGEEREVGIFAVRKEAIDDYLLDFTSEGLSVEVLSIGYLGLLNYIFYDLAPKEPSIVIDIGATHTDLILVDGKRFWIRALPHSGNDISKAIMDRFKLSFAEAEKLKVEAGKAPQQAVKIFSTVIQPKLKELVGEIHRSSGYYRSQAGDVKFQNLYLLGGGSKIVGIKKYLQEQLGLQVHRVQSIQHFRVSRDVDLKLLQGELPSFATAFGCSLQGLGSGTCKVDLIPQEERIQKDLKRKRKHAFFAMGIVYAAIVLAGIILNGKIDKANTSVDDHKGYLKETLGFSILADSKAGSKKKADMFDFDTITRTIGQQEAALKKIADVRSLAYRALQCLGQVAPKENAEMVKESVSIKEEDAAKATKEEKESIRDKTDKVRTAVEKLNKEKRLFIPWMRIDRVEWPEAQPGAGSLARGEKKKATVPAYKVRIFAAIAARQSTTEESQTHIRSLLVDPLKKKLKDLKDAGQAVTIDTDVTDSADFAQDIKRLPYQPKGASSEAAAAAGGPRRGLREGRTEIDIESAQAAGSFFGTEISWYMRLADPKEEEPEPVDDAKVGKTGRTGKTSKTGKTGRTTNPED
jgi:type IV pilus assembly protein PilM